MLDDNPHYATAGALPDSDGMVDALLAIAFEIRRASAIQAEQQAGHPEVFRIVMRGSA